MGYDSDECFLCYCSEEGGNNITKNVADICLCCLDKHIHKITSRAAYELKNFDFSTESRCDFCHLKKMLLMQITCCKSCLDRCKM